ncbi:hypothetical protein GH714_038882 [Hevea brasiliensis]|uniref:C2 domain-containing protein n=1 Tax=Hevea brasiliensis TaxID=3981 RepID=A0A6A6MNJ7_HEVBR|nr:hypothetical protein GH714_038882 [Hevea brasiliensis]
MDSAPRTLEITVLSAENLRLDGKSVKKDAFVVVKFDSLNSKSTKADHEGGSNPSWNQKLEMDMPMHARFIVLEVQLNYLHFLSYRLRDARGVKNGIINVSVKVNGLAVSGKNLPHYQISSSSSSSRPTWGLPAVEQNYPGGVVTGVPVWCASRA